jgi:F-type H+-transporting ATPase subunit b
MKKSVAILILSFVGLSLFVLAGTALAAGGGEESPWNTLMLTARVVNTIALIALLVYFLKTPLVSFFKDRTSQIEKDLQEAKEGRERAEASLKEYESRIAGMEKELETLRGELRKSAELESQKVAANAERMAKSMVDAARLAAEQEVRKARAELQNEAVSLAIQAAETLIRESIGHEDQQRIVADYLARVEGMK